MKGEGSARSKSDALKKAGAIVPATFGALGPAIKETYEDLSSKARCSRRSIRRVPKLPKPVEEAMKAQEVMVVPLIRTTISDDRGDEPCMTAIRPLSSSIRATKYHISSACSGISG